MGTIEANTLADANLLILAGAVVGLILWILICYFVDRAADRKNRSFTSFFLIAFFVSPIVGTVIVAALPPTQEMLIAKGRMRACGRCAQAIPLRAFVCPYCGSGPDLVGPGAQQAR